MDEPDAKPDAEPDEANEADAPVKPEPGDEGPLTTADFHTIAQKQILNAVFAVLAEAKMDWALIRPFLDAARELCLADFEATGRVRLHTMRAEGEGWVEAEEAFLGISVGDRDTGEEWLSETWWLSDVALAEDNPEEARRIVRALEKSIARINARLEEGGQLR